MDRNIHRSLDVKTVHSDSAFRRNGQPPNRYRVYFNPNDSNTAERLKNVVGVGVERASIPTMHDNIIEGLNVINLHISGGGTSSNSVTIPDMDALTAYMSAFGVEIGFLAPGVVTMRSVSGANVLLTSESTIPGNDAGHLLVTSKTENWSIGTFPVNLSLSACENHRVLLKPGYAPTHDLMIKELFDSFESILPPTMPLDNALFTSTDDPSQPGWSSFQETNGSWTLQFTSQILTTQSIFLSREPTKYGIDALSQFGLRNADVVFKMEQFSSTSEAGNTIVPQTEQTQTTSYRFYVLRFAPLNLNPRRYVDIVVENIPETSITNNQYHIRGTLARIDLSNTHRQIYGASAQTLEQESYAFYEAKNNAAISTFDPVSLHFFQIRLVDNLGVAYKSDLNHHIEFKVLCLGDAKEPFKFPVHSVGSVARLSKRELLEEPMPADWIPVKKRRRRRQAPTADQTTDTNDNPILSWISENRLTTAGTLATFFGVLFIGRSLTRPKDIAPQRP